MGEHDVQDRVKTPHGGTSTVARTRAESEAGPFSSVATRVADASALKSLIEASALDNGSADDDRKTREVDPVTFRALLKQAQAVPDETEAKPPQAAASDDDGLEAAFSDPDVVAREVKPAVQTKPSPALPPARGMSTGTLLLASILVLAVAAIIVLLVVALG